MSVVGPGCVKRRTRGESAESFSLFSSFYGTCQSGSFLIQCNRDKRSTRKFDVGVFTQPGSSKDLLPSQSDFRSAPRSGRSKSSICERPLCAISGRLDCLATFRRKIGALGRVVKGAQQRKTRRERPAGGFTEPDGEGGRIYRVARFSIARPMLMRLSAMTPRPTQRFIPASPL